MIPLLLAVVLAHISVQGQQVGTVFEVRGQWIIEGKPPRVLATGTALPGSADIRPPVSRDDTDYLVVIYANGDPVRFECPDHCRGPLRLKAYPDLQSRAVWTERWHALERLFWGNPKRYVPAITRGMTLPDAVIGQNAEGTDVGPLLSGAPPGRYALRFRPLAADGGPTREHAVVLMQTDQGARGVVPALPPGIYEVSARADDARREDFGTAWALVTSASEFDAASTAFAAVRATMASWSDLLSGPTRRALLRASLEAIATR